jgi:hypothetical protein
VRQALLQLVLILLAASHASAQDPPRPQPTPDAAASQAGAPAAQGKKKPSLYDSLDGKFDLSDRIIEGGAFVPVPIIVTEPALGGFGGGLAPVFIHRKPPREIRGKTVLDRPDVTAVMGAYTANSTWFAGGARMASLPKHGLHYVVAGGYGTINIDFYETLPSGQDKAFGFNGQGGGFYLKLAKELFDPRFTVGAQYLFGKITMKLADGTEVPSFITDASLDGTVSALGPVAEFDGRDSIFTADRGVKLHAHFNWSDDWLGSDYGYGRGNAYVYGYVPIARNDATGKGWVSGLRADWQQATGDPPFYLLPFVDMRGIPSARYQGRTTYILESEQRIDLTRRWSALVFGGLAKAFDSYDEADDADLLYSYGSGFRYLIARKFKLRMGVDVARGPEEWAFYIVFGSAWTR